MREEGSAEARVRVRCGGRAGAHRDRVDRSRIVQTLPQVLESCARHRLPPPHGKSPVCGVGNLTSEGRTARKWPIRTYPAGRVCEVCWLRSRMAHAPWANKLRNAVRGSWEGGRQCDCDHVWVGAVTLCTSIEKIGVGTPSKKVSMRPHTALAAARKCRSFSQERPGGARSTASP